MNVFRKEEIPKRKKKEILMGKREENLSTENLKGKIKRIVKKFTPSPFEGFMHPLSDPLQLRQSNQWNRCLVHAVIGNDLSKADEAVRSGANVNYKLVKRIKSAKKDSCACPADRPAGKPAERHAIHNKFMVFPSGTTMLHVASGLGLSAMADLLIANDADVNAKDSAGWTPLMLAANEGHAEICKQLLDAGAVWNARNKQGWTADMLAESNRHAAVIELFKPCMD